jgi:membrane protein YqaA with SNARE-associated domain
VFIITLFLQKHIWNIKKKEKKEAKNGHELNNPDGQKWSGQSILQKLIFITCTVFCDLFSFILGWLTLQLCNQERRVILIIFARPFQSDVGLGIG